MASASRRKRERAQPFGSFYEEPEPFFFVPVVADAIQNGKLEMPGIFMKRYRKEVDSSVNLKVQNHEASRIELCEENQKLWLGKGFDEFLLKHCVSAGHLLAFRFQGNSSFDVMLFDSCEMGREYPEMNEASHVSRVDHPAFKECDEFKTKHYPYICIPMRAPYMKSGSVNISSSFLRKADMKREAEGSRRDVTLKYLQNSWTVQLIHDAKGRGKLSKGWEAFIEDNSHRAGETIVLEHIRAAEEFKFKVTFFKK